MNTTAPESVETPFYMAPDQKIVAPIQITSGALAQIRRVLAKKGLPNAFLRLGVRGGGCSGLSYVMKPDTEFDEFDRTWQLDDVRFVIDAKSITFLEGTTIDYDMKNLLEGGFKFDNPHAVKSCGCGTSFTPK